MNFNKSINLMNHLLELPNLIIWVNYLLKFSGYGIFSDTLVNVHILLATVLKHLLELAVYK
jgi:hypothetical protein